MPTTEPATPDPCPDPPATIVVVGTPCEPGLVADTVAMLEARGLVVALDVATDCSGVILTGTPRAPVPLRIAAGDYQPGPQLVPDEPWQTFDPPVDTDGATGSEGEPCPADPDGQHHLGCGCDPADILTAAPRSSEPATVDVHGFVAGPPAEQLAAPALSPEAKRELGERAAALVTLSDDPAYLEWMARAADGELVDGGGSRVTPAKARRIWIAGQVLRDAATYATPSGGVAAAIAATVECAMSTAYQLAADARHFDLDRPDPLDDPDDDASAPSEPPDPPAPHSEPAPEKSSGEGDTAPDPAMPAPRQRRGQRPRTWSRP